MTDTQIVDWIQENLVGLSQNINEEYELRWLNDYGQTVTTIGTSLRDCVERACNY